MRQILWFRRDLRITDSALLCYGNGEVLPIFIFDTNILKKLPKDDKRVTFIYQSVLKLKGQLQNIGLDLAIFYGNPKDIFDLLQKKYNFDEVLCSCDFDSYAKKRDSEIERIVPMRRFYDSYLIQPNEALKNDGTPYKVFTPFYKSLFFLWESKKLDMFTLSQEMTQLSYQYERFPTLEDLGFLKQTLPDFLEKDASVLLEEFIPKLENYQEGRDYFSLDATSKLSVHLRFGLISPREIFNRINPLENGVFFIRELFWREFYSYILYHYPKSEFENFNQKKIIWSQNSDHFKAWCEGNTGVPIIDASMRYLNLTGLMHNRLRMIVTSFLTKNLFLPWEWGEQYFALKLLDYDASSNIGSWQWGASTGADSVPYFRVFNPYTQSAKFDKDGVFIKSVLKELQGIESKLLHKENGVSEDVFIDYLPPLVNIKKSRENAIKRFAQG